MFRKTLVKDYDVCNKLLWFNCLIMLLEFHGKIVVVVRGKFIARLPQKDKCCRMG